MSIPALSSAATDTKIDTVTSHHGSGSGSAMDLVIGAVYTLLLAYQDAASNDAATVSHAAITVAADREC